MSNKMSNKMSEQKEILIFISKQLDKISDELKELNTRMDRLEGKTDDLHDYIPFVGWLEEVGQNLSKRFKWLHGYKPCPVLLHNSDKMITN